MPHVKCAECGLLAVLSANHELREVSDGTRKGEASPPPGCVALPICSVAAHDLSKECPPGNLKAFGETAGKSRECEQFIPWLPGFSPKEHLKMQLLKQQREADLKWQAEQREKDAERDDRLRKEDLARAAEAKKSADMVKAEELKLKTAEVGMKKAEFDLKKIERIERWVQWGIAILLSMSTFVGGYYLSREINSQKAPPIVNVAPPNVTVVVPPTEKK